MSSTNKTTNYDLSQYVSSDKPTYLVDYNGDMQKIDTGIKGAYDKGVEASTDAANALSAAHEASTDAANALSAAHEASTEAAGALALAQEASTEAAGNTTAIGEIQSYLDVKNYVTPTATVDGQITGSLDNRVTVASNDDGSLAKIYGFLGFTKSGTSGDVKVTLSNTGLNPTEAFSINPAGILRDPANPNYNPGYVPIDIKANGDIEFTFNNVPANRTLFCILWPCVYFIKSFGDIPE